MRFNHKKSTQKNLYYRLNWDERTIWSSWSDSEFSVNEVEDEWLENRIPDDLSEWLPDN